MIGFLRDLVAEGLDQTLADRTPNPGDLLFQHQGENLELAIEADVPEGLRSRTPKSGLDTVRYQVAIGFDETRRQFELQAETLMLKNGNVATPQRELFPTSLPPPKSLQVSIRQ